MIGHAEQKSSLTGKEKKEKFNPPPDSRSSTSTTTSSTSYGALHESFSGQPSSQSGQDIREPLLGKEKERRQPSDTKLSDKLFEEAKKQAEIEAYEEFVKEAKRTDFQTDIEYTLRRNIRWIH